MAKSKKIDKDMGFRLKKARLDQKLTYDELSEMSGVSSRYIKEIENHGNIPSLEKLGQLIRALHISADPFFYPAAPTDNLDYQQGTRFVPDYEVVALAEYFQVSCEYLLGVKNEK